MNTIRSGIHKIVRMCTMDDVRNLLRGCGLEKYIQNFDENGWDTLEVLQYMKEKDVKTCIDKAGHRKIFFVALGHSSPSTTQQEAETSETNTYVTCFESKSHSVTNWLQKFGLGEHAESLYADGWNTMEALYLIEEDDISRCIYKPGHRKRLLLALGNERSRDYSVESSSSQIDKAVDIDDVKNWLQGHGLEQYTQNFVAQGWDTLEVLLHMTWDDICMCIEKAGHRMRFWLALDKKKADEQLNGINSEEGRKQPRGEQDASLSEDTSIEYDLPSQDIASASINTNHTCIARLFDCWPSDETDERHHFKSQMKAVIGVHEAKDTLYVETRALSELVDVVEARHMAIIIGVPGDGKSAMAYHLSLQYIQKGYEYLELHFAREWKDFVDGSQSSFKQNKQFAVINDIFGRMSVDDRKVSEWCSIFELMERVVNQRNGNLIVVCTCRKYIFMDVKSMLSRFAAFQDTNVVDLTSESLCLNADEKLIIWKTYAQKYEVKTPKPSCIEEDVKTPHGFPHCVELFCSNTFLQKKGNYFFKHPEKYVEQEIAHFMQYDRKKYFVLLLILLNHNKLSTDFLENMSAAEKKRMCEAADFSDMPASVDLRTAICSLETTYIINIDNYYSFSHDLFREMLALRLIREKTIFAIQELDFSHLIDHTRCSGQLESNLKSVFILPYDKITHLVKRVIKEIKNGNVVSVCAHEAWENDKFVKEFMLISLPRPNNDSTTCLMSDIFETKDSTTSCIFYFNLFDALNFYRRRKALEQILANADLKRRLQDITVVPQEVPLNRVISKKISKMMDGLGATKENRNFLMQSAVVTEILDTLCIQLAKKEFSCYLFGSQTDGTHIPTQISKLESDVSYMLCRENCEVIFDILELRQKKHIDYLAVSDENSSPGYVKLQIVRNGIPLTKADVGADFPERARLDYKGRVVACRLQTRKQLHVDESLGLQATTRMVTANAFEQWHSYRCRIWPDAMKEWLNRVRHHNWPSRHALEQMKSLGFFLVPIGCRESIEEDTEWKMAFLLQERMLIRSFNDTQHKCFLLLKMINNEIINHLVNQQALTSYHLKMCMFHVIENTEPGLWISDKLLYCVNYCLSCILKWTVNGMCPNYFILEENMFYKRIHGGIQTKLRCVIEKLLSCNFEFYIHIRCGNLGAGLRQSTPEKGHGFNLQCVTMEDHVDMFLKSVRLIELVKTRMLSQCCRTDISECVQLHIETVAKLRKASSITEHSKRQITYSVSLVLPYIELSLMGNVVAWAAKNGKPRDLVLRLLLSKRWTEMGIKSNLYSARLSQAMYLYDLKYYEISLDILESLKYVPAAFKISICGCRDSQQPIVDADAKQHLKGISEDEFRVKYCMPCVCFLPTELKPEALKYECKRSQMRNQASRSNRYHFWFDWAVADSKVLLHFLLYLNHRELKMANEAESDIENIIEVLNTDPNLGHKETGYNILGWIYRHEGNEKVAKEFFQKSVDEEKTFNAAYIHLLEAS